MKTIKILSILLFAGVCSANAQNVQSTSSRTSGGLEAGGATSGTGNTFYGYQAGKVTASTGVNNTFIGQQTGKDNTTGDENTFIGFLAGFKNTTASANLFIGNYSGIANTTGGANTFVGYSSGQNNNGVHNVFLGEYTGGENTGSYNTFLGGQAGGESYGSNNVFIGYGAGYSESGSNKLCINNSDGTTPLIWGDFALDQLKLNGKVGIGNVTTFPTTAGSINVSAYNLFVKGGMLTEEVRVMLQANWADYVFAKEYKLPTLEEVEQHISEKGHLKDIPSAGDVAQNGIELGEMNKLLLQKIEELTLYMIEQKKETQKLREELKTILENKK